MTRFSISNIAWPADADDEAVGRAAECGFEGIELAPMKVFGPLEDCPKQRLADYRNKLADLGLAIPALQAILFGVQDCELFRSGETRTRLARHLRLVAEIAGALGAKACVFGAPTLRDPGDLDPAASIGIAVNFFADIAGAYEDAGTALAFEANPPHYKCRFVTETPQAIQLVQAVGRAGFRLQIDTGTVFINGEDPGIAEAAAPLAAHFHASEKDLAPIGTLGSDHAAVAAALGRGGYAGWRSVEMRSTPSWRDNVRAAIDLMRTHYDA